MFLSQHFATNHSPRFAPTIRLYPRIERLLIPAVPELSVSFWLGFRYMLRKKERYTHSRLPITCNCLLPGISQQKTQLQLTATVPVAKLVFEIMNKTLIILETGPVSFVRLITSRSEHSICSLKIYCPAILSCNIGVSNKRHCFGFKEI